MTVLDILGAVLNGAVGAVVGILVYRRQQK